VRSVRTKLCADEHILSVDRTKASVVLINVGSVLIKPTVVRIEPSVVAVKLRSVLIKPSVVRT
jgi:hypothetical protein